MSNSIWAALVAQLKAGEIEVEEFVQKAEAWVAQEIGGLGGLVGDIVSADINQIALDYKADLQQIVTNIQNSTQGLTFTNFLPLFIAAAAPVVVKEGMVILDKDWNILAAYFSGDAGITNTPANNGNLPGGNSGPVAAT